MRSRFRQTLTLLVFFPLVPLVRAQPFPETKWTPSDPRIDQEFGAAVALDGAVAIVGAFRDDDATGAGEQGAAYVFRYDGSTWVEEQKLTAPQRDVLDWFGWSVAVSGDVALVGARNDEDVPPAAGAVYVFRYDGSAWVQEAKLTASDAASGDHFGRALAIEGDVALVGAALQDLGGFGRGAAYVYRYDGNTWTEVQKLTASDPFDLAYFGESVALSGGRVLIGAWGYTPPPGLNTGAVYVFEQGSSQWMETARLVPHDTTAQTQFGLTVDLDGDRAIIGAPLDRDLGAGAGAAYVFRFDGSEWAAEQKLTASDWTGFNLFGSAVALEGPQALVGSDNWFPPDEDGTGKAYLFAYDPATETWEEEEGFVPSDATGGDTFAAVVALDGGVALVGAPGHDLPLAEAGAAYAYGEPVATAAEVATPPASSALSAPAPNPFRERVALELTVGEAQPVTVAVYDLLGRRIAVLHEGMTVGTHRLVWDAGAAPAGVYVVRVEGGTSTTSRRIVRLP